jgi:hypothetical protein
MTFVLYVFTITQKMKILYSVFFLFLGSVVYGQQSDCVVKLPRLAGYYKGECKKGMAHGEGVAQGIDRYEGHFFKGLPDGKGIYTWQDGAYYDGDWKEGMRNGTGKYVKGDSVLTGYWKQDNYKGKKPASLYRIGTNRNVARYSITKSIETGNGVKIKILLGGRENSEIEDLALAYSSGSEYRNINIYGIQNSSVPLDVTIRYRTWNQLHSVQYDALFEFTILEPGIYNVTLTNM